MSKITLQGDVSGTGTLTIAAPNTNTNRTLNLPDEAGTVLTNSSNIEAQVKTATNATGDAPVYACRSWVNFNGTGTVAIRAAGNVSSITDNGAGDYTVNFTTAMPDANYTVTGSATNGNVAAAAIGLRQFTNQSTASVVINCVRLSTGAAEDRDSVQVAIFR